MKQVLILLIGVLGFSTSVLANEWVQIGDAYCRPTPNQSPRAIRLALSRIAPTICTIPVECFYGVGGRAPGEVTCAAIQVSKGLQDKQCTPSLSACLADETIRIVHPDAINDVLEVAKNVIEKFAPRAGTEGKANEVHSAKRPN